MRIDDGLLRKLNTFFIRLPANLGARVYRNTSQSIGNAAWEAISFNTERWDTAGPGNTTGYWKSATPTRLTAIKAGHHYIAGSIEFEADATGFRGIAIGWGATPTYITMDSRMTITTGQVTIKLSISTLYWLEKDEYVQLFARQNTAGNLSVVSVGNYAPEFSIVRIP